MSDIFLSYDSRDLERIKPLAAALAAQGWLVFYDRTIPPGKTWRQVIGKEIDECRCMVVAWSTHSIESNWVLEEADDGLKREILVPVFIDQVKPPRGFRAIQAANLADWDGDQSAPGFLALCAAVIELIGSNNRASQTPEIQKQHPPKDDSLIVKSSELSSKRHNESLIEPEMIEIPAGSFQMGGNKYDNEQPIHTVTFAKPFKLGKYPVTFAEYDVFAEKTGCKKPDDEDWGRDRRPVIHVSWQDAVDYAAWLRNITGKSYRLPSEAEWEYACRSGSTTEFFWGNATSKADEFAWFDNISHIEGTRTVGQLKPNPYGLYDITGNVWEWVQDDWHDNYQGAPNDASAWKTGQTLRRALRGGSIYHTPFRLRSADRFMHNADYHDKITGFRLAQD